MFTSKRGQGLPYSPIRKLVPLAEKAKSNGIKVYHLNIGQPDIETPEPMKLALRKANFKVLEYSHSAGNLSYRTKLAQYYTGLGYPLHFDDILITTGGSEALVFAFFACLDSEDEIIIPEPFYANYNTFALMAGVKIITIPSYIETGFALPPINEFEKKISSKTKAILICSPNNPTGYVYNTTELNQLKNIVKKHNLLLFSDEAYRDFCYEAKAESVLSLSDIEDQVVVFDTISKRYSACGARIGALISKNKEIINSVLKLAQARLSPPGLGQIMGEAALALPPEYFVKTKNEYKRRRDTLHYYLNKIPGVISPLPSGAFYTIATLPIEDADHFCAWLLAEFSFEQQTVMLAPASGFYFSAELGKNQVRLAYVLEKEELEKAMVCLAKALEKYQEIYNKY